MWESAIVFPTQKHFISYQSCVCDTPLFKLKPTFIIKIKYNYKWLLKSINSSQRFIETS
jgi:hypothetical protein